MSRYLWVDMVCINQGDVHERNAQIRIMGRIFESARTVFGWLGPEANLSRDACRAITRVFETVVNMGEGFRIGAALPATLNTVFNVEGISEGDPYVIFALFQ